MQPIIENRNQAHQQRSFWPTAIAVIDSAVADYERLIAGLDRQVQPHVIGRDRDGVAEITQVLALYHQAGCYPDLYIVAHGSPGYLALGNTQFSRDTLTQYAAAVQRWFATPATQPNLYLYGCNVAAGDAGAEFVASLQALTGATIHASSTILGNAALGGNWDLDIVHPAIASPSASTAAAPFAAATLANYAGILPTANPDTLAAVKGVEIVQSGNLIANDSVDTTEVRLVNGVLVPATGLTLETQYGIITVQPNGNYTYTVNNVDPEVISAGTGDTLVDTITYTAVDGLGVPDTSNLSVTITANDSFPPGLNLFYQTIANDPARNIDLSFYNPILQDWEQIRELSLFQVNATAYNPVNNYLYAIAVNLTSPGTDDFGNTVNNNDLVRIDRRGLVLDTGINVGFTSFAGDFDELGNYWLRRQDTNGLARVNITTGTVENFTITGDGTGVVVADLAYNNTDGKLYGARDGELYIFDIDAPSGTTINLTRRAVPGLPIGVYGAAWVDLEGRVYVGLNTNGTSGEIYEVVGYNTASPTAVIKATATATNANDGSADPDGYSIFESPFIDLDNGILPPTAEAVYIEDNPPTNLFGTVQLHDEDAGGTNAQVLAMSLRFSGVTDGTSEVLLIGGQTLNLGIDGSLAGLNFGGATYTVNYTASTGVLQVAKTSGGNPILAELSLLLNSVQYQNTSNNPSNNARGLVIGITDLDNQTTFGYGLVTVVPVNDPPVLDLDDDAATTNDVNYTANFSSTVGTPVAITDGNATLTDPDDTTFANVRITYATPADGANEVLILGGNTIALDNSATPGTITVGTTTYNVSLTASGGTFTLTLTGSAGEVSQAEVVTLLNSITYDNNAATPTISARTFNLTVNDGAADSNVAIATVNVLAPGNNAPIVAAPVALVLDEDDTPVASLDLLANSSDPNNDPLTVTNFTADAIAQEFLNLGAVTNNGNGTLSVNPNIYKGLDEDRSRVGTFSYTLDDGQGGTVAQTATVTIAGRPDIYWHLQLDSDGSTATWQLDQIGTNPPEVTGGAFIVDNTTNSPLPVFPGFWQLAVSGDVNNDGYTDAVWQAKNAGNVNDGQIVVWTANQERTLGGYLLNVQLPDAAWKIVGLSDFDGDNDLDLIWRNDGSTNPAATGNNAVWLLENGQTSTGRFITSQGDPNWQIGGAGDFDGDGIHDDLMWWNKATGDNAIWLMDHNTGQSQSGNFITNVDPGAGWRVEGIADINSDGISDIFWRSSVLGVDAVWYMNGSTTAPSTGSGFVITSPPDLNWNGSL